MACYIQIVCIQFISHFVNKYFFKSYRVCFASFVLVRWEFTNHSIIVKPDDSNINSAIFYIALVLWVFYVFKIKCKLKKALYFLSSLFSFAIFVLPPQYFIVWVHNRVCLRSWEPYMSCGHAFCLHRFPLLTYRIQFYFCPTFNWYVVFIYKQSFRYHIFLRIGSIL